MNTSAEVEAAEVSSTAQAVDKLDFMANPKLQQLLRDWAKQLNQRRGDRAAIRRCHNADEVCLQPAFVRFYAQVVTKVDKRLNARRMAAILGLIAHLECDEEGNLYTAKVSVASQFATAAGGGDGAPLVHPLRFQRLLQCDRDHLYPVLRRLILHCKRRINPFDLANAVFYWGQKIQFDWAYDYYAKAQLD